MITQTTCLIYVFLCGRIYGTISCKLNPVSPINWCLHELYLYERLCFELWIQTKMY